MSIIKELQADGWEEYSPLGCNVRRFYKNFHTNTPCNLNQSLGVTIYVAVSKYNGRLVLEDLELRAGMKDGTWMRIGNWTLPATVQEVIARIPRLLSTWESANACLTNLKPLTTSEIDALCATLNK